MLKNYLLIAWRNLWNHKLFSLINLLGLTISICVSLVVFLIVRHELSYDKYHADADRIFRIVTRTYVLGEEYPNPGVPIPLAQVVKDNLTGVEEAVGFFRMHDYTVTIQGDSKNGEKVLKHQNNLILTDPGYFRLFKHQWLAGNPETALKEPFQVVLTESKARSYFELKDPSNAIGREIIYRDSIQTVVSGIIKDNDKLTDFDFGEFISISTVNRSSLKHKWYLDHWDNVDSDFQLMVKLNEAVSPGSINDQLITLRGTHQENYDANQQINELQQLNDLHFNSTYGAFMRPVASRSTLMGLIVVAILLVVLGSINYINLTTARGNQRAAEIGIRKTLGGTRKHLTFQFITETILLSFIAALCALLVAPMVLNLVHDFLPAGFIKETIWEPYLLLFLLALSLLIGAISGLYPGLILSKYKPTTIIKETQKLPGSGRSLVQLSLTVLQFAVATFFIVSTWIVILQIRYAFNHEMGFDKEGILTFSIPNDENASGNLLLQKLKLVPEIEAISRGGSSPASTSVQSRDFSYSNGREKIETNVMLKYGDEHYLEVYGLELLAGKNITQSDTIKELIINETFIRRLGIDDPSAAIGQVISGNGFHYPIVGVVSDFNTRPIHSAIHPTAITNAAINANFHIRLKELSGNTDIWLKALDKIESAWKEVYPDETIDYQFYDQRIASWYQEDQRTAQLLKWISGIAVFISCIGLLGLVILLTGDRTKEIGIRKVLGASVSSVAILLATGLFKLILIAAGLSIPISWIFVSRWLENFAYSIAITWWMFALPALLVLAVALITISAQVFKVALANPVEALRNE